MVLDQVPQFGAALEVGGDHRGAGAQAVWAASCPQHALWNEMQEKTQRRVEERGRAKKQNKTQQAKLTQKWS